MAGECVGIDVEKTAVAAELDEATTGTNPAEVSVVITETSAALVGIPTRPRSTIRPSTV
jgi:hypothetical protein